MSDNLEYLRRAALILAGPGQIKQRLLDAHHGGLQLVDRAALPAAVGTEFAALLSAFSGARATGGLSVAQTAVRKMSEQEAGRHAQAVIGMLIALSALGAEEAEAAGAPHLRVVGEAEELPAFLSRA